MPVHRSRLFPAIFICLIGSILIVLSGTAPMSPDEGKWFYAVQYWTGHESPYQIVHAAGAPGILLLFRCCYLLVGSMIWLPRCLSGIAVCAVILMVYGMVKTIRNVCAAVFAMIIAGCTFVWQSVNGGYGVQQEAFAVFFTVSAVYLLVRVLCGVNQQWQKVLLLTVGGLLGLAAAFSPTALMGVAGIAGLYIVSVNASRQQSLIVRDIVLILAGVAGAVCVTSIPFIMSNMAIETMLNVFVGEYAVALYYDLIRRITLFINAWRYTDMLLMYPIVVTAFFLRKTIRLKYVCFSGISVWFLCELAGFTWLMPVTYPTFLSLLVPVAILCGITIEKVMSLCGENESVYIRYCKRAAWCLLLFGLPFRTLLFQGVLFDPISKNDLKIVRWITDNTVAADHLLICTDSAPMLYLASGRKSPTRFLDVQSLMYHLQGEEILSELEKKVPQYIIVADTSYIPSWLAYMLRTAYIPQKLVGSVRIYARNTIQRREM